MVQDTVGVVILCWKNYQDSVECLNSLLQSTYAVEKIVVVDNASCDGSLEKLRQEFAHTGNTTFIENSDNYGFSKGMNVGIRNLLENDVKYILLLNQDTVVDFKMIEECLRAAQTNPSMSIIGPRIYYAHPPDKIWQGGGYFSLLKGGIFNPEKNQLDAQCDNRLRKVTFLTGCAILVNCHVFRDIGLFDEDYFFYSEDLDFCYRAQKAGYEMWYVPTAKVWHKISDISKDRTGEFALYNMAKSNIIFFRKNCNRTQRIYGILMHIVVYTPYRLWQICRGSKSLKAALCWFKGTRHGLRKRLSTYYRSNIGIKA